jgi:proteasome lid subunit RPN8/RPN11
MLEVRIERAALATMLASTREVFSNETYGLLLGKKSQKAVEVLHAVPCQVADRTRGEVSCNGKTRKLEEVLRSFATRDFQVLGDFHSHPVLRNQSFSEYSELSDSDYEDMEKGEIYALITAKLRDSKKYALKYAGKMHELSGQWSDLYFNLKVYAWHNIGNCFSPAPLKCRGTEIKRK